MLPTSYCTRRFYAILIVLVALMGVNLGRLRSLGMADSLPSLVVVDAIPPALSNLVFDSPRDHTSLSAVSATFYAALPSNAPNQPRDVRRLDRATAAVLALNPKAISRESQLLTGDDKGIVDFVKLAFMLFGYHPGRIVYLYFLLLFGSVFLFVGSFPEIRLVPVAAAAFLLAHYLILPAVYYNLQLSSVLMPRFLPVLGLIACLHGLFFSLRPRLTPIGLAALSVQAGLLIFTVHLRAVTIWELALVGLFGAFLWLNRILRSSAGSDRGKAWAALIPGILLLVGAIGLSEYRQSTYNRHYLNGDVMATRPFWHNILSGFALNPELAAQYGFKIDDSSEVRATGRYLTQHNRLKEWLAMGGTPVDGPWVWSAAFPRLRLGDYDHVARDLIFSIMIHQPGEFLATFAYYKPRSLIRHLAWLYGFRRNVPDVAIYVSHDVGDAMAIQLADLQKDLDQHRARFSLWDPFAVVTVVLLTLLLNLAGTGTRAEWLPLAVLGVGSLIPTTVGYAGMHTIAEPALMAAVLIYVAIACILADLLAGWHRHANPVVPPRT